MASMIRYGLRSVAVIAKPAGRDDEQDDGH
jgi:hypothetical protein